MAGRLSKFSENHILTESKSGFRPGRRCADQVLSVKECVTLQEVTRETDIFGISGCKHGMWYDVQRRIADEDERVQGSGRIYQCMQKLV